MKKLRWTIILSLLAPLLFALAFFIGGAGHGIVEVAILLFPSGFISTFFSSSNDLIFIVLAIFQYPVYGLLIDRSLNKNQTVWWLIIFHLLLAVTILMVKA